MTGTSTELSADAAKPRYPGPGKLTPAASAYYALVVGAGVLAAAALLPRFTIGEPRLATFAIFATAAGFAQLFTVDRPGGLNYKASVVFLIPAAFLLRPELLVPFAVVQYLPDWVKTRKTLKVQAFNIAKGILDTLAAWATFHALDARLTLSQAPRFATAALVACVVYVFVNHLLLALIVRFTSGKSLRDSRLFSLDYLSTDLILSALGGGVAALWVHDAWVVPFVVGPLVLTHRALAIPQLEAEARVDAKTGLYNTRHFSKTLTEELARAQRFERPLSLIMADLDLLREINNTYGHLAGDAVIQGIADIMRSELRQYDMASRFGGEEFSLLLPETDGETAFAIAERIRRKVAEQVFESDTTAGPIRATISMGVATFPQDGADEKELVHAADVAVYGAKVGGRNRVVAANPEHADMPADLTHTVIELPRREAPAPAGTPLAAVPEPAATAAPAEVPQGRVAPPPPRQAERAESSPEAEHHGVPPLGLLVAAVGAVGVGAGVGGLLFGTGSDYLGLVAMVALVAGGQALSFDLAAFEGAISVGAVGSLAGAAIFGFRAALLLALAAAIVDWSMRRTSLISLVYNVATLSSASLAAAGVFSLAFGRGAERGLAMAGLGLVAGCVYFGTNMALVSVASALERRENPWQVFQERFAWLLPHYVVYGFIGAVIADAYASVHVYALVVFALPLLLMRKTQEAYISHTRGSTLKLQEASDTIKKQNVSLERANQLLRDRTTAAMESLSATVDARDAYTAGHSRRVQQLALAIGNTLGLSDPELDLLGHAALFHDIGKLAVPDAILLKPGPLTPDERQTHPSPRRRRRPHHRTPRLPPRRRPRHPPPPRTLGRTRLPRPLAGEDIPLGARIIHVADALDSMLTTRIYRAARPTRDALNELHTQAGTQFCPRCVTALDTLFPLDTPIHQIRLVPESPLAAAG